MAFAFVQSISQGQGSSTTNTKAFTSNVVANNLLIVCIQTGGSGITVSIADTVGTTYSQTADGYVVINGATQRLSLWYGIAAGSGANTVTATLSSSALSTMAIHEYSGNATTSVLDGHAHASGVGTAVDSGSCAVNAANELIFACCSNDNAGNVSSTAGTGFTRRENITNGASVWPICTEDQVVSAATNGTVTLGSSQNWNAIAASFKLPSASGGPFPFYTRRNMYGGMIPMSGGVI